MLPTVSQSLHWVLPYQFSLQTHHERVTLAISASSRRSRRRRSETYVHAAVQPDLHTQVLALFDPTTQHVSKRNARHYQAEALSRSPPISSFLLLKICSPKHIRPSCQHPIPVKRPWNSHHLLNSTLRSPCKRWLYPSPSFYASSPCSVSDPSTMRMRDV